MKVGIFTFPNSTSFGASLQMYALYHALDLLGVEVEVINYHNAYMKNKHHTAVIANADPISRKLRLLVKGVIHSRQIESFKNFEKTMIRYPERAISDPELLPDIGKRYDAIICGSDQVWNPNITDSDMSFFLNFCGPKTRRISYAPSFGISEFSEDFQNLIRNELEQFNYLSVREIEGQRLLENLLGRKVHLVLDPTFLLSKGNWAELERSCSVADEPYILYYTVAKSDNLFQFCLKLAEEKGLKMVVVGGNVFSRLHKKNNRICYAHDLGPQEWLYLVHHAQCVVTNSFHGTAFSINYQKDFYVEFSSATNSRLEQIIRSTGLEDRVVRTGYASSDKHIDYLQVNAALMNLREASMDYLRKAVGCDER